MKNKLLIILLALTCNLLVFAEDVKLTTLDKAQQEESLYLIPDAPKPTECIYGVCPLVKENYITRIRNIDYQNGVTHCYIYEKASNKLVGTVKQANKICKDKRVKNAVDAKKEYKANSLTEELENYDTKKGYSTLKEKKDFYLGSYIDTGDREFLDVSKFMIAGLTIDDKIININESINKNRVVLRDEYTQYPNSSTDYHEDSILDAVKSFFGMAVPEKDGSEIVKDENTRLNSHASAMLSNVTVFIMHFMSDYNAQMLSLKAFLFFTILPFTGMFLFQSKLTKHLSEQQDHDDLYERMFMTGLTLFVFYFATSTIKINNLNYGEETKISQSHFQNWFRGIFYQGAEMATEVARAGTSAFLKYKIQDIGVASKETLISLQVENKLIKQEQTNLYLGDGGLLSNCYKAFDTDKLKVDLRIYSSHNATFPNNETIFLENEIFGKRLVNWYSSGSYLKKGYEDSPLSANGCYNIERNYLENKAKLEALDRDIAIYENVTKDETIVKQVDILASTQLRNSAELGWIGFTMIPSMNIAINELQIIDKSQRDDTNEEIIEQIEKDSKNINQFDTDTGHLLADQIGGIAYMMLPSADTIFKLLKGEKDKDGKSQGILGNVKDSISFIIKKVPYVGLIIGKIIDFIPIELIALIATIYIMKFLVVIFPLIGIIMAGVMVTAYYFFSIEIYYLISPFIIAFAMASQQGDVIKKYLKVGVTLALKPIMIVISLILAIWVYEFFNVFNSILVDWNFSSIFAVKDAGGLQPINTLFLTIAKEFIHIGIQIIAFIVVFYMVLNGANMIMDMFGISDANVDIQSSLGSNIDSKASKWNNGGM